MQQGWLRGLLFRRWRAVALGCVALAWTMPLAAQTVAVPDSGTADAGIASAPIAHVTANDTVNGAPAALGASGNATIAKVGTWPAGFALSTSTGSVTTSAALAAGSYSFEYKLCDKNSPPDCATATDTVTVITAVIEATPDTGSANSGVASIPIANVAANDTVDGSPVTLGTSGNATVAKLGTWASGIVLNTSTGAVSTTAAGLPGIYILQYKLCDKNSPPVCAATTATVTVLAASVVAVPVSGSADTGVASAAIANVAVNDTVNGAPATLGTFGNATVAKVGTWPTSITLSTASGAVITSAKAAAGTYTVSYNLCDKGKPALCASSTATITVTSASIVAVAQNGSFTSGIPSVAIVNVTANDTVDGAPVMLGAPANVTLSPSGSWPSGITLNTATGAISTAATLPPATYAVQYQLCDFNMPPKCASASATLTAVTASIIPGVDTGIALVGTTATPIANVAANDTVNGAPARLGQSGNATVAQIGNWPSGITLDPNAGAVYTSSTVPVGSYPLQYQLCDLNTPPDCAIATDVVLVSLGFTEVQVSPTDFGDIEFDWGRDGIYCAACSFGEGNARFNWPDSSGNVWIGHVDPTSGAFTPPAGMNELVDSYEIYVLNGPEWAFSTQNGQVISQLVYTRTTPGQPATQANAGVAIATPIQGGWDPEFLPGVGPAVGASINTVDPIASQCNTDPISLALFNDLSTPQGVYWEPVSTAPGTAPITTPFGAYFSPVTAGKPSQHWIPCTHQLVFIGSAPPDPSGNIYQQVFWYDADTNIVQQLTTDSVGKAEVYMFAAPEFQDTMVFYTISNNLEIDIYEQTGSAESGAPTIQLVNRIFSPDPTEPYIGSTEPFINCTPTCQSYIFMKLSPAVQTEENRRVLPNGIAVTNINPAQPFFEIMVPYWATPTIQRTDLEYYITNLGPYLYYGSGTVSPPQVLGRYYVDMQLGAPSGSCVGSSAEDGMLEGC
jgi:hypothetical protein